MGFSDRQIRALHRNVSARNIRARVSDGKELSYIEGWFAIAEANRIFGFDGWDRETVEAKCIQAREVRGSHSVLYTVKVRMTVRSGDRVTTREGFGTGEGHGTRLAEAHDLALKAAETDATKRALVTFGKAFGLGLYGDARRKVVGASAGLAPPSRAASKGTKPIEVDAHQNSKTRDVAPEAPPPVSGEISEGQPGQTPIAKVGQAEPEGGAAQTDSPATTPVALLAPRQRIDKSGLTLSEPRRVRDKDHLRHVASQSCILCNRILADAHHLRFAQPKAFGAKVSDEFTVPLCRDHHRELHSNGNERAWWHDMGVDPLPVAKRLWEESRGER
jgi:Rad52/22 family double-strand break repair protein